MQYVIYSHLRTSIILIGLCECISHNLRHFYSKWDFLECVSCQNLEKNSRKHKSSTDFTDSECGISFLSDMRCMIRPQNYSVRKNFSN